MSQIEKTTKEKLLEEFDKTILEPLDKKDWGICPSQILAIKEFFSQAIDQTREETIREILNKLPKQQVIEAIVDADNDLTKAWSAGFNNCLNQVKSLINK